MQLISSTMGVDNANLMKALNFLPYPLLLSELHNGVQRNIFVNKNFIDEIGYTCEDIPTISAWFATAYPDTEYRNSIISDWTRLVEEAKKKGRDYVIKQAQIKTKFQGEKWYEVKASLFGAVNIVAFVNIDEEIRRERQLELLNENKNRTLSILSHDLRSPLASLHSALQLLTENAFDETEKKFILTKLNRQVFQMMEFLDTTLQWTRSNFSDQKPVRMPVPVYDIMNSILALYADPIAEKHQKIRVKIEHEQNPLGDPEVFSILLRNLVSNATKYTPISGVITLRSAQGHDSHILEVENSGVAIRPATVEGILNKKYVSARGTSGEKGIGVGLRLCLQVLEPVNGKMEIETPSPDQTLFRIILPNQEPDG